MIIVEGCDGSGKSTLVESLEMDLQLERAQRFAGSKQGPPDDLYRRMVDDMRTWDARTEPLLYDRHPMISEYIYGPVVRGTVKPGMAHPSTIKQLRPRVARQSLVILCQVPISVIAARLELDPDRDMPGVVQNIGQIWAGYGQLEHNWPGWLIKYDYTAETDSKINYESVLRACRLHIAQWRRNNHG